MENKSELSEFMCVCVTENWGKTQELEQIKAKPIPRARGGLPERH